MNEKPEIIDLEVVLAKLKQKGVPVQEVEEYLEILISSNASKQLLRDQ